MSLVDISSIASLLTCPRCGSSLTVTRPAFRCSSESCAFHAPDSFPVIGSLPALVDFERSILQRSELAVSGAGAMPLTGARRWAIDRLPSGLRSLWKPPNRAAEQNVGALLSLLPGDAPLVLVIGGGTIGNGVEALYADQRVRLVAFDVYGSPLVQFIADAHRIPLSDQSVDGVVIQAVLEHVLDPPQVVAEAHRVLRDGGIVYVETPFLQQVHAGPYDFTRYTSSGHRFLLRNFEEIAAGPVAGPGTQLLWSIDHLVRGLTRSELAGKLARAPFFWLRQLDRLVPAAFALDSASAYYFLGRRSDRELRPHEIVDYYAGAQRPANVRRHR
jgi:SAM-dependent methyltransferase